MLLKRAGLHKGGSPPLVLPQTPEEPKHKEHGQSGQNQQQPTYIGRMHGTISFSGLPVRRAVRHGGRSSAEQMSAPFQKKAQRVRIRYATCKEFIKAPHNGTSIGRSHTAQWIFPLELLDTQEAARILSF